MESIVVWLAVVAAGSCVDGLLSVVVPLGVGSTIVVAGADCCVVDLLRLVSVAAAGSNGVSDCYELRLK